MFFIGGLDLSGPKPKPNKQVYSLNLETGLFKKEKFKLPENVIRPICATNEEGVLITGGKEARK